MARPALTGLPYRHSLGRKLLYVGAQLLMAVAYDHDQLFRALFAH
jgi:hypothetical protein